MSMSMNLLTNNFNPERQMSKEEHTTLWDEFADIDPKFTKPITGKQYKGTSPSPQYVILCLTKLFGPVGVGFGWEIVNEGFQPLGDEILHWCRIRFWHTDRANTFEHYGQTKALMKTKNGMMADEDAPKKSLTDAVIKAASHIGIASNIFLGRWDDQKYVQELDANFRAQEAEKDISDAIAQLSETTTLTELADVFTALPAPIKGHPKVLKAKDDLKARFNALNVKAQGAERAQP